MCCTKAILQAPAGRDGLLGTLHASKARSRPHGATGMGGAAVKRNPPTHQRRDGGGWKESPLRPLTSEGKKRRAEWLRTWKLYMGQLLCAEAEQL